MILSIRVIKWIRKDANALEINQATEYFKSKNVICKIVYDNRPEYGDFIAVFGYGELSRSDIANVIENNNLACMFFEGAIRENANKKKVSHL